MKKRVYIFISIFILLIIMMLIVDAINGHKIINNIYSTITGQAIGETEEILLSYIVYDNQDSNNVKVLVTISSETVIEYVQYPNGNIVNGNGKNKISIDYTSALNKEEIFKVRIKDKTEKDAKMTIKQEEINDQFIVTQTYDVEYNKVQLKDNGFNLAPYELYYKIENDDLGFIGEWNKYNNRIELDKSYLEKEDESIYSGNIKFNIKRIDQSGNIVYALKRCEVRQNFNEYIVYNAGTCLGTAIGGRTYNKLNDGFALAGSCFWSGHGACFMLVAKSYDSALGWCSYNPSYMLTPVAIEYEGEKWYYAPINYGGASGEGVYAVYHGKYLGVMSGEYIDIATYMLNDFYGK